MSSLAKIEGAEQQTKRDLAGTGFLHRLRMARMRLAADPRFQRWTGRLPLVRRIARREADDLFELTAGFVFSQVVRACVAVNLFERLADRPRTTAELASECRTDAVATARLLQAADSLGLVYQDRQANWWPTDKGAVLASNPGIRAMIAHHDMLYRDLTDPAALLAPEPAPTNTASFWSYAGGRGDTPGEADATDYSRLMAASQPLVAQAILDSCSLGKCKSIMDVGGGSAAFLAMAGSRYERLQLRLFDLPPVVKLARLHLDKQGMASRSQIFAGDFMAEPLPGGSDCVTLIRVLCDHDDDAVKTVLRRVHACLPDKGRLIIAEPMAGADRTGRLLSAYFSIYFLAMRSGRCRTPAELVRLAIDAGFDDVTFRPTASPLFASLVTARKQ